MLKSIEVSAKTEDEALAQALAQLNMERDEVSVEILERAKSGFLGIGSSPARLRVSYEAPDEVEPPRPAAPAPAPEREKKPETKKEPVAAPAAAESVDTAGDMAKTEKFLTGLFERMNVAATPVVTKGEDGIISVKLEGENMGSLIGRRGETLDAIQHLTNYTVNHGRTSRTKINIDAENYREKRAQSLQQLAQKVAGKVVRYRRNVTLEPMNAYERHVIHTALQDFDGVTTYSTGTEPNRRIVVAYERPQRSGGRDYQPRNNRSDRPAPRREAPPAPAPQEEKPAPRYKEWS